MDTLLIQSLWLVYVPIGASLVAAIIERIETSEEIGAPAASIIHPTEIQKIQRFLVELYADKTRRGRKTYCDVTSTEFFYSNLVVF